jgi:hypothetical protein
VRWFVVDTFVYQYRQQALRQNVVTSVVVEIKSAQASSLWPGKVSCPTHNRNALPRCNTSDTVERKGFERCKEGIGLE